MQYGITEEGEKDSVSLICKAHHRPSREGGSGMNRNRVFGSKNTETAVKHEKDSEDRSTCDCI